MPEAQDDGAAIRPDRAGIRDEVSVVPSRRYTGDVDLLWIDLDKRYRAAPSSLPGKAELKLLAPAYVVQIEVGREAGWRGERVDDGVRAREPVNIYAKVGIGGRGQRRVMHGLQRGRSQQQSGGDRDRQADGGEDDGETDPVPPVPHPDAAPASHQGNPRYVLAPAVNADAAALVSILQS